MKCMLVKKINSSWKFLNKHLKIVLMVGFFVLASAALWHGFGSDVVLAEGTTNSGVLGTAASGNAGPVDNPTALTAEFWLGLVIQIILALARLCLSLTMFIMTFIIQVAGYNGYLNSSAVTVGWVMVRDMTNMGFVVVLLIIAFGTILGLEHYEWKKMLVKLVMAAILVNFSRTICGVFIDIAQVVMVTFVNGIAATAGGNLIQMFNLDKIRELSSSADQASFNTLNFFVAAVMSLVFSVIVMLTMAVFLAMLVARMVVLWVLIVLSPLAFVLSILPQTESYASEWWHEFGANIITGPVLLFFVWLAFVTAGNGRVNEEITSASNNSVAASTNAEATQVAGTTSGIGAAMGWDNMANFIIAVGMLIVGSRAASKLGGVGGEWAGSAVEMGKKVGMYAGGIMAARWAADKAGDGAKWAGGQLAKPLERSWEKTKAIRGKQWDKLNFKRNEVAKDLESEAKAHTDLKAEYERHEISKEDYDRRVKAISGGGLEKAKEFSATQKAFNEEEKKHEAQKQVNDVKLAEAANQLQAGTINRAQYDMVVNAADADEQKFKETKENFSAAKVNYNQALDNIKPGKIDGALGSIRRGLKSAASTIIQSSGRADKEVEDWKAAAEFQHKITEEDYSTSALAGGQEKAKLRVIADAAEHMAHAKSTQKIEEMKRSLSAGGGSQGDRDLFKKFEEKAIQAGVRTERATSYLDEHMIKTKAEPFEFNGSMINYYSNKIDMEAKDTKKQGDELKALASAAASANQFVRANQLTQQADSLVFKKVQEGLKEANLNSNERANVAGTIALRISELRQKQNKTPEDEALMQTYIQQKVALTAVNASLTAYDAQEDMRQSLKSIKWTEPVSNKNQLRRQLSVQLGRVVQEGQEVEAEKELKAALGGEQKYQAAMRQLAVNAKNQVAQGNRDFVMFEEKIDDSGRTSYSIPVGRTGEKQSEEIMGTLRAWFEKGDLKVGSLKEAFGTRSIDAKGSTQLATMNAEEMNFNAKMLAGATAQTISRMEGGLLGDINDSSIDPAQLIAQLEAIARNVSDAKAFDAVIKKMDKVRTKLDDAEINAIRALAAQNNQGANTNTTTT